MKPARDWKKDVDAIRRVLVDEWNPIGFPVPDDEYDNYIQIIYLLMQERASVKELAHQLEKFESISMGLNPRTEANQRVATILLAIMDSSS
jgi:hypothetical protein